MSSPYRGSSYYKDSYLGNLPGGKRFGHLSYDGSDDRKRHRLDHAGSSQTSSRYNSSDYQHRSSSYIGGKPGASYDGTSHHRTSTGKPSTSSTLQPLLRSSNDSSSYDHRNLSSSSKYMDSASSRRYEDLRSSASKFSRIPPPLASLPSGGSYSARSKASNGNLLPLMKLSVDSSSKEYYGSRYRQAPPEHHREGAYNYGAPSQLHPRNDTRRSAPLNPMPRNRYNNNSTFRGPNTPYGKNLAAIRKATQMTAANVTSRIRKRAATARISRDRGRDNNKRYYKDRSAGSTHRADKSRDKSSESKDPGDDDEVGGKKRKTEGNKSDAEESDAEGKETLQEEQPGDDEDEEMDDSKSIGGDEGKDESNIQDPDKEAQNDESTKGPGEEEPGVNTEGDEQAEEKGEHSSSSSGKRKKDRKGDEKADKSRAHIDKDGVKAPRVKREAESTTTEKEDASHSKALLKLNCYYCNIRCISFREFTAHLRSYGHTKSMNNAVSEMRKKLNLMRSDQRDQQRKLEKSKSDKTLSDTTSYCRVCELNFRTDPTEHEANELHNCIKMLIYQRCDVCDIDFRIWKVYLYHMAALEHAKRVAMKELQERESRGETVKGTNLSQEELGFDLVEQRTVLYCNACIRYIPIKDSEEETKTRHCMTFSHIKYVDEFNERERKYKEKKAREEERKLAAAELAKIEEEKSKSNDEKKEDDDTNVGASTTDNSVVGGEGESERIEAPQDSSKLTDQLGDEDGNKEPRIKIEVDTSPSHNVADDQQIEIDQQIKVDVGTPAGNDDEEDEDEIELHADIDDDAEEESEDRVLWTRRTRSSTRKGSKSSDSNMN